MTTSTYVDANLHDDQVTGRAVTACLPLVKPLLLIWHSKRQATVETATFGCEFVAARIATDQIIDLRYTLMYLGVPVRAKSYMFDDNKSVVDSTSIPTFTLSKKSTLTSYHLVREAIATEYLKFNWKAGKSNAADILSNHWEFASIRPLLKPLLEIQVSSMPIQRGVTEFLHKIYFLSSTLMDQRLPIVSPSSYPMKCGVWLAR